MEEIKFRIEKGPSDKSVCTIFLNNRAVAYAFAAEAAIIESAFKRLVRQSECNTLVERVNELIKALELKESVIRALKNGESMEPADFFAEMRAAIVDETPAAYPKGVI